MFSLLGIFHLLLYISVCLSLSISPPHFPAFSLLHLSLSSDQALYPPHSLTPLRLSLKPGSSYCLCLFLPLPLDFPRSSPADCIVQVLDKPNKRGDRSTVYRNGAVLMNRISKSSGSCCSGFFLLWPRQLSRSFISHKELCSCFTDWRVQVTKPKPFQVFSHLSD